MRSTSGATKKHSGAKSFFLCIKGDSGIFSSCGCVDGGEKLNFRDFLKKPKTERRQLEAGSHITGLAEKVTKTVIESSLQSQHGAGAEQM